MQGEDSFDALAVRDSAHGECFVDSAALTANDYTSEYLNSFLVAFYYPGMNAHAVPHRKQPSVAPLLFLLDSIDDLIHEIPFFPPAGRGNSFQQDNRNCNAKSFSESRIENEPVESLIRQIEVS